jgi:hypothetical protein
MLFDLRGRRRRGIQAIYLTLAILMGGGLVLFGIGGDVQGGLFDAFSNREGDAAQQIQQRVDQAEEQTRANPRDANAWGRLAEARYQLAGQTEGYVQETGAFTGDARRQLELASRAWDRHLELAGDDASPELAATMRNALIQLGAAEKAVQAQEIVLEDLDEPGHGDYAQLAVYAYQAGQTRKGDLAAERAKELAPEGQRENVEQSIEQAKMQAIAGQAGGAGAGEPGGAGEVQPEPQPGG